MATPIGIRWRRSFAERHALVSVEREIRATDSHGRRKYLREFVEAFRAYESVLSPTQLDTMLRSAGVLLVGDYHALPNSQRFAAGLLEQLSSSEPKPVLGLEMIFSRDQHILDEWLHGDIDESELRERVRFDLDWGYDWTPFRDLLLAARSRGMMVYGLDCMPRFDMRRIVARDRHAADKIAEIRKRHPGAPIVVLFGESHLAPAHLPESVAARLPGERILSVLQNVDELYWQAAGERGERVAAVRVSDRAVCVFNSTPLEKYESYRLCLERWKQQRAAPDLAPSFYNLIDALLRFLNIDKYSPSNGTQPRFLVDLLPEVYGRSSPESFRRLLERKLTPAAEIQVVLQQLEARGSAYVPRLNALLVSRFEMLHAAQDAAQFVHCVCSSGRCRGGEPPHRAAESAIASAEDVFYRSVVEEALADFGSRVLYPARPAMRERDLYPLYAQTREAVEERSIYSYRDYMEMLDFLVLHKDYEENLRGWVEPPSLLRKGVLYSGERFDFLTRTLGHILGSEIYDAWIAGRVAKRTLRSFFFRPLDAAGAARTLYFTIVRRIRKPKRRLLAA
jgi:hypothetical protein